MNPGICYLYEYEKNQRKRNVGFIKIARHYQSCVLQIHARGIPVGNGAALELHAFYSEDSYMVSTQIAVLNCFGRNISARLPVTETHFPDSHALPEIDGFLICLPGGTHPVFWAASDKNFYADISRLRPPKSARAESTLPKNDEARTDRNIPSNKSRVSEASTAALAPCTPELTNPKPKTNIPESGKAESTDSDIPESNKTESTDSDVSESYKSKSTDSDILESYKSKSTDSDVPESYKSKSTDSDISESYKTKSTDPDASESNKSESTGSDPLTPDKTAAISTDLSSPAAEGTAREPSVTGSQCLTARKIQRSDISSLPRRFWTLANNSFLLHGYHNYNHLLLVEEDGHMWLGVPGVYHPREARAADLFGFPQFTRSYAPIIGLNAEERNDDADFGHWCRYLGTSNDQ